jgi:hypothetical protein
MMVIFASNIGGSATLIGDPPNIMIGSATGLGFNDFLFNLAPLAGAFLIHRPRPYRFESRPYLVLAILERGIARRLAHGPGRLSAAAGAGG